MLLRSGILFITLLFGKNCVAQAPEFYKDVQPIIHTNCVPCHRTGEAAPFLLITFDDVNKRSKFIKQVISSRYMPPWKADNHYNTFANDRSLSERDIQTIVSWVDAGSSKGKPNTKHILHKVFLALACISVKPGIQHPETQSLLLHLNATVFLTITN